VRDQPPLEKDVANWTIVCGESIHDCVWRRGHLAVCARFARLYYRAGDRNARPRAKAGNLTYEVLDPAGLRGRELRATVWLVEAEGTAAFLTGADLRASISLLDHGCHSAGEAVAAAFSPDARTTRALVRTIPLWWNSSKPSWDLEGRGSGITTFRDRLAKFTMLFM